jgi:hypothetical protein
MAKNITDEEVAKLEACQTSEDWANACDEIKAARGGVQYPDDWWAKVKTSGMMQRVLNRWGDSAELNVRPF